MKDKLSTQIMVIFPILGGAAIGGFAIHRFINGQFTMAIYDALVAFCFFGASFYTWKTGNETVARYFSAVITVLGPLVVLKQFDSAAIYWIYSSAIVLFYLLQYRWAIAFNIFMLAGVAYIYASVDYNPVQLYSFVVTIGLIIAFSLIFALAEERFKKQLQILSLRDELTGIGNRRAFVEKIREAVNFRKRHDLPVSLLYIDIDKFKLVNDTLGHGEGDLVLVRLSAFVKSLLRETDSLFRIGGDEFVVIAEGADGEAANLLGEKLRHAIEVEPLTSKMPVTISMGIASVREEDDADSWISRADTELYHAKETGRNQIRRASEKRIGQV